MHLRKCLMCGVRETIRPYLYWTRPCRCCFPPDGVCEWIHKKCVFKRIDSIQEGDLSKRVSCDVCKFTYYIFTPDLSVTALNMNFQDMLITLMYIVASGITTAHAFHVAVNFIVMRLGDGTELTIGKMKETTVSLVILCWPGFTLVYGSVRKWTRRFKLMRYLSYIPSYANRPRRVVHTKDLYLIQQFCTSVIFSISLVYNLRESFGTFLYGSFNVTSCAIRGLVLGTIWCLYRRKQCIKDFIDLKTKEQREARTIISADSYNIVRGPRYGGVIV